MWLKQLFACTLKNVKSGFRKWLEDLPRRALYLCLYEPDDDEWVGWLADLLAGMHCSR
jgi:hypothetical protein